MRSGVSSPGRSCGKAEKSLRLKLGGKIVTGEMCIRIFVIATAQIEIFRVSKKNGHSFYFCDYSVCCRLILKLFGRPLFLFLRLLCVLSTDLKTIWQYCSKGNSQKDTHFKVSIMGGI